LGLKFRPEEISFGLGIYKWVCILDNCNSSRIEIVVWAYGTYASCFVGSRLPKISLLDCFTPTPLIVVVCELVFLKNIVFYISFFSNFIDNPLSYNYQRRIEKMHFLLHEMLPQYD